MSGYEWAIWELECGHRATGASGAHENSGFLYCPVCVRGRQIRERTAWVVPIPQEERIVVPVEDTAVEDWKFTRRQRAFLTDAVMVHMKRIESIPENDKSELPELQVLLDRLMARDERP